MAEPKFDIYQTNAINARKNSVVSAGAGSGKTTVLAERFSSLVLDPKEKVGVDQILTLTFTKKATVEMSARIYKVLKKHAPEKAADFFKANIKTLDSYCNSVAKMGCHYYGISPDFTQDNEQIKATVYAMALPYILEHRDNAAVKALVSADNFDEIASELFVEPILSASTVAEPIDFDRMLRKQVDAIVEKWNASTSEINRLIIEMEKMFNNLGDVNKTSKAYIEFDSVFGPNSTVEIPEPLILTAADIESCNIKEAEEYVLAISRIASLKKPGNAKGLKEITPTLNSLKDQCHSHLYQYFNFIYGYGMTLELLPLLKDFQDKVNAYKRSSGILSFKDISNMAKCILRDYPEIRQIEKEKYRFIMIDEFQDNNSDQRDMLFMLAEKKSRKETGVPSVDELEKDKLFFVGDEKQSIYRFRGADVSVFNALSEDFTEGNLNMTTNYRSDSALIKGFNTIFGGFEYPLPPASMDSEEKIMPTEIPSAFYNCQTKYENGIPTYEAKYKEVLLPETKEEGSSVKSKQKEIFQPHIHFALFDREQDVPEGCPSMEEAEAQWIADKIEELTTTGINGKVYSHNDIAILMRTYALQPLYERTFLKNGIPYNTEVVTGFFADGPVNDIFSILRLCAYPDDTAAYAQVLRSPWVNLSFEQANEIIFNKDKKAAPFDLDASSILPEEALERYNHAKEFFNELIESAKTDPLTKTVSKLWYESGYRYETLWNKTVSMYGKLYDLIFELARQSEENKMTLGAFVDSVRTYRDQAEKLEDMDIPFEQTEGVHILSIHKSKGLEYPVVFVIGTHKNGLRENNSKAVYVSKEYGITLNTPSHPSIAGSNAFYHDAHEENKAQSAAELRRLAYVALTRAKDQLFITNGKYKANENFGKYVPGGEGNPESIFSILEPVYNYYFAGRNEAMVSGPFTRTFINPEELGKGHKDSNNEKAKIDFINKIEEEGIFEKAVTITKETPSKIYANPSQLHVADDETYRNGSPVVTQKSTENSCPEYDKINRIIESTIPEYNDRNKEPAFSHANFGTIAHAYLEAKITGTEPVISNRDIAGLEDRAKSMEEIKNICTLMADRFENTELGKRALSSKWHKAEYEFRCRITLKNGTSRIIKGTIDLVFENKDGTYTVVDYKTNQEIKPEIYRDQLACYRRAVSQMMNVSPEKVSCSLYYLRFDREVDITAEASKADLAEAIEIMEKQEEQ